MNLETLRKYKAQIFEIGKKNGAYNIRVFGSTARAEDKDTSDIDIIVSINNDKSYFDLIALWQDLQELLDCKVDLLTDDGISPYVKEAILKEAVLL